MSPQDKSTEIESLQAENRLLRMRVAELERGRKGVRGTRLDKSESRIFRLVQEKDKALQEYASRMEQKMREMQAALSASAAAGEGHSAANLCAMAFENDPAGLLIAARDGRILRFNSSAIRLLGVAIFRLARESVESLRLESDPEILDFGALFKSVLEKGERRLVTRLSDGRPLHVRGYCLTNAGGIFGVVFRLEEAPPAG